MARKRQPCDFRASAKRSLDVVRNRLEYLLEREEDGLVLLHEDERILVKHILRTFMEDMTDERKFKKRSHELYANIWGRKARQHQLELEGGRSANG